MVKNDFSKKKMNLDWKHRIQKILWLYICIDFYICTYTVLVGLGRSVLRIWTGKCQLWSNRIARLDSAPYSFARNLHFSKSQYNFGGINLADSFFIFSYSVVHFLSLHPHTILCQTQNFFFLRWFRISTLHLYSLSGYMFLKSKYFYNQWL